MLKPMTGIRFKYKFSLVQVYQGILCSRRNKKPSEFLSSIYLQYCLASGLILRVFFSSIYLQYCLASGLILSVFFSSIYLQYCLASGLILSGLFSSIYLQYICLGVLHGLGAGFIFTAGQLVVIFLKFIFIIFHKKKKTVNYF